MANRILKPLLSAVVATVFTLSASAQVTDAGHPQPSRRGISRQEMLSRRAASTQPQKIFRNGQIVILLDGKAFAPSGIELR